MSEQGLPWSDGVAPDDPFRPSPEEIKQPDRPKLRDVLGPGLVTGASDDDPSGIATYSQAGAQFGYSLGWTLLLTYPLMCAIQMISAQIGRVTGLGFSNVIALFIMLTTAATLNAQGVKDIQTSSQAAEALRPIAGEFAFAIFALGIIGTGLLALGTGLLALPVLAGSAAYAVGEALQWRVGLTQRPGRAKAFYGVIAAATLVGAVLNFTPLDPIKALFWSAVINGVAAVPIMVMIMLLGSRQKVMRQFTLSPWLKSLGWLATAVMAAAAIGMFATWGD